jgi:hypothetical protein
MAIFIWSPYLACLGLLLWIAAARCSGVAIDLHQRLDLLSDAAGPPMISLVESTDVRFTWELLGSLTTQAEVGSGHHAMPMAVVGWVRLQCTEYRGGALRL